MKPIKQTLISFIVFLISYAAMTLILTHSIDIKILAVLSIFYLILNLIIYTVLDKVSKS
ncbi:hypothetical protein Selli1_05840 [Sellimonas catena]|uniref:Uncharacterized protein n=1 Tax=Sellimonas catena TaxID=2994035 RepID=A0A9W6C6B3_9FIRM|nr:hypothetical protein Selli1_05840 [Sellimonas catena]